jgi:hypothetical protein
VVERQLIRMAGDDSFLALFMAISLDESTAK